MESVLTDLEKKSYEFFKLFSRAEYSLKASGFNCGDGNAKADWESFAQSIDSQFISLDHEGFKKAVEYIDITSPKKQVITNGVIEWSDSVPQSTCRADLILLYIRRVRNNLFHGGKFNGVFFAPVRSEELLEH